jgi:hypothetical protein
VIPKERASRRVDFFRVADGGQTDVRIFFPSPFAYLFIIIIIFFFSRPPFGSFLFDVNNHKRARTTITGDTTIIRSALTICHAGIVNLAENV